MGSDVTGTSVIITVMQERAVLDPDVSNVIAANGVWGAMTLLDAGGDAVRWARRGRRPRDNTMGTPRWRSAEPRFAPRLANFR